MQKAARFLISLICTPIVIVICPLYIIIEVAIDGYISKTNTAGTIFFWWLDWLKP